MPGTRPSRKYPRKPRLSKKTNRKTKKNPKSNKKLSRKQRAGRRPKNSFSKCLERRYCNKKFDFDCPECGISFEKRPSQITKSGTWCSICKNKGHNRHRSSS